MRRIIYTVAAAAAVLTGSVAAAAPALASNGPGQSISAYYWQPNGHALGGPRPGTADLSNPSGLALMTENAHGQNIAGQTITITAHMDPTQVTALHNAYSSDVGAYARVWFDGAGGTSAQSPQGYLGQVWWANVQVQNLNSPIVDSNGEMTLQAKVDPSQPNVWSDWNGKDANQNQALFNQAASHVQQIGLSFGGASFFEDGVTGTGAITIDNITVAP
jgi:hypothetical protein